MSQPTLVAVTEAGGKVTKAGATGRTRMIQLIDVGWGSSGYYSAETLQAAASERVFPAGTHMYLDHPTATEAEERPERSVKDLAAVLASDAVYVDGALVGEATIFAPYREPINEMASSIGVSIRASAEVTDGGTAEGRRGRIIERLVPAVSNSVDFVTHAGRGGKVLEVLESARVAVIQSAVAHGVNEATANDTRQALDQVLRDAYGGEKSWVWVRDFDETTVWFEHETPDESGTWAQGYSLDDAGAASLSGDRTEVRARTEYVPATRPDSTTTTESGEVPMGQIQVDEAVHNAAVEKAGRVDALETERDTEKARADAAEARLAEAEKKTAEGTRPSLKLLNEELTESKRENALLRAENVARPILAEALTDAILVDSQKARLARTLLVDLPLTEALELDETAFGTRCQEAIGVAEEEAAELLQAAGVGTPRGLGGVQTPATEASAAKATEELAEVFKSFGLSEAAAATAVKGR